MADGDGPLAATLARIAAVDPWFGASVGPPAGEGWFRLADVRAGELAPRIDALAARHGGHRDVAGSYLGGWLSGAAVISPVAALVLDRRLPDPDSPVWVHGHEDGWFDTVAFERPDVLVLADDAAADHPDTVVVAEAELAPRFAAGLVARLAPALEAVRSLAPFGRRGLWGAVADEVASAALWAARSGGTDQQAAWRTAEAVIDAVAAEVPWLRARPAPYPVAGSLFSVKGTCCLFHKTQPGPPDPCGESYCTSCPFRDDGSRRERLVKLTDH